MIRQLLEHPFNTEARTACKAIITGKIAGEFDFGANIEMLTKPIPYLRLGKENTLALPPNISETRETQTLEPEEILTPPDSGELKRNFLLKILEFLIEDFQIKSIIKVLTMKEIVNTDKNGMIHAIEVTGSRSHDCTNTTVVLNLCAESPKSGVLPKIEATRDLKIRA